MSTGEPVAFILLDVRNENEVRATLAELPLVTAGPLDRNVIGLQPLPELARLLQRTAAAPPE